VRSTLLLLAAALTLSAHAQTLPFLSDAEITAIASEIDGETAKRNLEGFSRHHRMRGSRPFRAASEQILAELKRYGFTDARIESFPADGTIFYGTQRSRPPWNADFAELWEVDANGARVTRLASWEAAPITLAQDSESADVTATLVDVGAGTTDADYANKEVKGKIVLTSSQAGPVAAIAVAKHGAAGIISYAQNQRQAWYGENENLIRWGHLDTFAAHKTFAFMVSLKTARALQARLAKGETVRLHAHVKAGQEAGAYEIATATIPGATSDEIVFSCHLDHPRPGANDNASGCATILEAARTLLKLIAEKRLAPPQRTIRFVWPPEIEGTLALLNGRPEIASRIKAAIHLDMVGGGPETKAVFHVTRGPMSQPSFVYDIAQSLGELVNEHSLMFASTGAARWPLVAPTGGKEALLAELAPFSMGSDHQVYTDSSWSIPAVYLNDWPDRYIHTNFDLPANIDPTKLARAGFIAAASGYALASLSHEEARATDELLETYGLERRAKWMRAKKPLPFIDWYNNAARDSLMHFVGTAVPAARAQRKGAYRRNANVKGPTSAFGYDYFDAHFKGAVKPKLAEEQKYEALNLVDGWRTTQEIRDMLGAIYGDVKLADVEEYLAALESIGLVQRVP
jgi:aminopeptidase YwaD